LENKIAYCWAGGLRELIFQEVSTGARRFVKATDIAKSMIKAYGMSEKLGQINSTVIINPSFCKRPASG